MQRLIEHYIERFKIFISFEFILTAGLIWLSARFFDWYSGFSEFALIAIILPVFLISFAIGEAIRRKFGFNSLFYYNTKDEVIREKIADLMKRNPNISAKDIANAVGLGIFHTEAYIRKLDNKA
ncbi:MAG: hypothetical protein FWB71_02320 [Defluviitaleaceae bacterium]|nr:hypothetical protein [Defluviitaleaceae bacterium]